MKFFRLFYHPAFIMAFVLLSACDATSVPEDFSITSTHPADLETGIPLNTAVAAVFSGELDPASIDGTSFILMDGSTPVAGTTSSLGANATFLPARNLDADTVYTATVSMMAKNMSGTAMNADRTWSFTTGAAIDTNAPAVISSAPAAGATNVGINTLVTVAFSEAMNPLSINTGTFTLKNGLVPVSGSVRYSNETAVFSPSIALAYSTTFTATIGTNTVDIAGNQLAHACIWHFTTREAPDTTPPAVTSTGPTNNAAGISHNMRVTATFSETMDPLTLTTNSFSLKQGPAAVSGTVTCDGLTATFTPLTELDGNTTYTATLGTNVRDIAGNTLISEKIWNFTTAMGPAPVNLRTAGNFVILAPINITVGAGTSIIGDIGLSPGLSTSFVGFGMIMDGSGAFSTSGLITGKAYAANYAQPTPTILSNAFTDMNIAYDDAAGRTNATDLGSGELGGRTIGPGLYAWSAAASITTDVTLSGGPNDVWIFRINGALSMAAAIHVNLSGGAQAKNIFWVATGAVSIGASGRLEGIVLTKAAMTVGAGGIVNGRLYADTTDTEGAGAIVTNPGQ